MVVWQPVSSELEARAAARLKQIPKRGVVVFTGLALKQRYMLAKEFRGVCRASPVSLILSWVHRPCLPSDCPQNCQNRCNRFRFYDLTPLTSDGPAIYAVELTICLGHIPAGVDSLLNPADFHQFSSQIWPEFCSIPPGKSNSGELRV